MEPFKAYFKKSYANSKCFPYKHCANIIDLITKIIIQNVHSGTTACSNLASTFPIYLGIYKHWAGSVCPPVYLHLIFEISSVTRFFSNFEISSLKNQKINLISKLIFAGYTGSKNQVRTRQKIKFVIISQIDFSKNQAQIDNASGFLSYAKPSPHWG